MLAGERIHADDTTVPVLAKGKTRTGRIWTYVRDDRTFAGHASPAALVCCADGADDSPCGGRSEKTMPDHSSEESTCIETHHFERGALKYLNRSIEMGDCVALRWRIENWGPRLRASPDIQVVSEFAQIEQKAVSMFEVELTHGEGALLNLDHPTVKEFCRRRDCPFSGSMIAAAKRFS